jgi:hypothetical protein
MKTCSLTLAIVLFAHYCCSQSNCSRRLIYPYPRLKSKLDSAMCVPIGFQITDIYDEVDLNNDGLKDKVVRYQRIELANADTIYYSIYTKMIDGKLKLFMTLGNLEPLYFNSYEFDDKTGNNLYDSIKTQYSYPTRSMVEFETNSIQLSFYTDAATFQKLFFSFDLEKMTWILTKTMQWFTPPKNYEGDEKLDENGRKLEFDRKPKIRMRIDEFNMLKYIGW